MEPVYRSLELAALAIQSFQGTRRTYVGLENVPAVGGGVVAINHTGYTDFMPLGLALRQTGRRARMMVKSELADIAIMRFLIKHTRSVTVDRSAGAAAFDAAVDRLRAGDLVAVYPEATISRSFELKEFKTGAARMAIDASVPVIPLVIWGSQRQWSKGTKRRMGRAHIPIRVEIGEPLHFAVDADAATATAELRKAMTDLLDRAQAAYPDAPAGADWLPARLGGGAPTPEQALATEDNEAKAKAAKRAERQAKKGPRG